MGDAPTKELPDQIILKEDCLNLSCSAWDEQHAWLVEAKLLSCCFQQSKKWWMTQIPQWNNKLLRFTIVDHKHRKVPLHTFQPCFCVLNAWSPNDGQKTFHSFLHCMLKQKQIPHVGCFFSSFSLELIDLLVSFETCMRCIYSRLISFSINSCLSLSLF